jgi:hypothetical protein
MAAPPGPRQRRNSGERRGSNQIGAKSTYEVS